MPLRRIHCRFFTGLILIGVVATAPFLSAHPHPNDFVLALTYDGLEVGLIDQSVVENLARRTAVDCGAANHCAMEMPAVAPGCHASACECSRCGDSASPCENARGCCVQLRLSQQPLFHIALAPTVDSREVSGVITHGAEFAETLRHKPPVPPPRSC